MRNRSADRLATPPKKAIMMPNRSSSWYCWRLGVGTGVAPFHRVRRQWRLSGPSIAARDGVTFEEVPATAMHQGLIRLDPFSAAVLNAVA